jgi:cation diffusion facilitator family transporter
MQLSSAIYSRSYSLISTTIDAFMDILANTILFLTEWWQRRKNPLLYPVGKTRMEPLGIILFAALMSFMALEIIQEAVQTLIEQMPVLTNINYIPILLSCTGIGLKAILWLYCRTIPNSSSAATLAKDHRNDITLNLFGISMAIIGKYVYWWLDPTGAVIIALFILRSWGSTVYEQILLLIGRTAPPAFLNKLTYIASNHHPMILQVDTCRAFYLGNGAFVEMDIVLPKDTPLVTSHDIGESLQIKLEKVTGVERAFVHIDYDTNHKAHDEHKHP